MNGINNVYSIIELIIFLICITNICSDEVRGRAPLPAADVTTARTTKKDDTYKDDELERLLKEFAEISEQNEIRKPGKILRRKTDFDKRLTNDTAVKEKLLSFMLNEVYMTRYRRKYIEVQRKLIEDDVEYQISYVYGTTKSLYAMIMHIYSTVHWNTVIKTEDYLNLYKQAVEIHVDLSSHLVHLLKLHAIALYVMQEMNKKRQRGQ